MRDWDSAPTAGTPTCCNCGVASEFRNGKGRDGLGLLVAIDRHHRALQFH